MKRSVIDSLLEWKNSPYRKPLILQGVRQVGKTWLMKEFGRQYYDNIVYFSFDEEDYRQLFEATRNPKRIIANLAMVSSEKISPETTLIIFDEIQDCPQVINSLKYFCEEANEYHIICAGSLLGVALARPASFPVGKVDFLNIYPMSFTEFLLAENQDNYVEYLSNIDEIAPIPDMFFNPLQEKLKMYYITGGMPEAVLRWSKEHDVRGVQYVQSSILNAYERDFAKHPNVSEFPKISMIWQSLPSQLARENKKFMYNVVKPGARAREYEDALQWLINAQLAYKVYRMKTPGLPMSAYDDLSAFKIYMCDVGLLRRFSKLAPAVFSEGNRLFSEFKGALTENFVLQGLSRQFDVKPRYWSMSNPPYEVDFLLQLDNDIIPIEVKSADNVRSRSLAKYKDLFAEQTKLRVRFSLENLRLDDDLLNIPLFMIDEAERLIKLGLRMTSK